MANDLAGDELFGVLFFFKLTPTAFGLGAIVGEHVLAGVVGSDEGCDDGITGFERTRFVFREAPHFAVGDYAFALCADVDEEALIIDVDDSSFDSFSPPEIGHVLPFGRKKTPHLAIFRPLRIFLTKLCGLLKHRVP